MIERGRGEKKKKKRVINQFKEDRSNFKEVVAAAIIHLTFSQGGSIVYSRGGRAAAFPLTEVSYSPQLLQITR